MRKQFKFYSIEDTFLKILEEVTIYKKSFIRFGDGEARIIRNQCGPNYQSLDRKLRQKLHFIIKNNMSPNLVLCFSNFSNKKPWFNKFLSNNISNKDTLCDTRFTRQISCFRLRPLWEQKKICYIGAFSDYISKYDKIISNIIKCCQESKEIPTDKYKKDKQTQKIILKQISKDSKINNLLQTIIKSVNESDLLGYQVNDSVILIKEIMTVPNYSFYIKEFLARYFRKNKNFLSSIYNLKKKVLLDKLFSNGKSLEYLLTNYKNSFQQLGEIEEQCLKKRKDTLFIISSGPMGKVLNYNLTIQGYQCLDIGHL